MSAMLAARLAIFPLCYLLGALPFSFLVVRAARGIDLRQSGSGVLGTANAARAAGLLPALLVFAGDFGKGALGMAIALRAFGRGPLALAALAMLVLGHNFSLFVRFSGGKGLAAGAGGLLILAPNLLLAAGTLGLAIVALAGDFYLAAMGMAAALPGLAALFLPGGASAAAATALAAIILIRHRPNLAGLWPTPNRSPETSLRAGISLSASNRDDAFVLSVAALTIVAVSVKLMVSNPTGCSLLPLLLIAGRWAAVGLALLAAWAAVSRVGRPALAFAAGAALVIMFVIAIRLAHLLVRGGALLLPPVATQIGDGSWPFAGQASVAAVAAHHLFWVSGLAAAGLTGRALRARRR